MQHKYFPSTTVIFDHTYSVTTSF